jgi:hypothetical protein
MPTRLHRAATGAAVACLLTIPSLAAAHQAPPAPAKAQSGTLAPTPEAEAYLAAVRKGDVAAVEKILAGGVAVDTEFRYKRTALSFAADRGDAPMVKLLLDKGANPDLADSFYNQTALAWAAGPAQKRKPEHVDVVRLLLAKGAKGRDRALGAAIGSNDVAMTQAILDAGGLPPELLSESLASAKKSGNRADIVAVLEKAGAVMPVVPQLTPAQLARYPATYNNGSNDITVTLKDGVLVGTAGGGPLTLSPRSETSFMVEGAPGLSVTFALEGERAVSLTVNQGGAPSVYKRVSP